MCHRKTLSPRSQKGPGALPEDFTFQLLKEEFDSLRRQSGASSQGRGVKSSLLVFHDQG